MTRTATTQHPGDGDGGAALTPSLPAAYVLARLLSDLPVNGEVGAVETPFRPVVEYLAGLPYEVRAEAWDIFCLAPGLDRDGTILRVAGVDPSGPPPEPGAEAARPRYRLTRAADIVTRPVEWLWNPRIPLGMITLFAGDPKLGKSFATVAIATRVSRGAPQHGDDPPAGPGSVILLSAEDDPARTIVPRLKTAGANLDKVHILESVYLADGSEALPSLRTDIRAIEDAVASLGDCRLIVVDPVSAYLGGTDDHKNAELRGVLSPLKVVAERTGAAVVLVSHLNKSTTTNGKHRVAGSIAYVGACRANFLFVRDQDDPSGRRVLMLANGCNLAGDVPTLAYHIEDRGDGPAVEWEADPVNITAETALAAETEDQEERGERHACDRWLKDVLRDGPVLQTEVESAGKAAGFSIQKLKRAKCRIGAKSEREGFGRESKCYWTIPIASMRDGKTPIEFT